MHLPGLPAIRRCFFGGFIPRLPLFSSPGPHRYFTYASYKNASSFTK